MVIALFIFISGVSLLWFFNEYVPKPYPNKEIYLLLLIYISMIAMTAYIHSNRSLNDIHRFIGFRKTRFIYILMAIIVAVVIWFFDFYYQTKILNKDILIDATKWTSKNKSLPIAFISTVIFAPIIEEMLLRGIFLQAINRYLSGFWTAIIISFIFAVIHFSPLDIPSLFMASLFYVAITLYSKSIIPAIFAHILNNCMTFFYYIKISPI